MAYDEGEPRGIGLGYIIFQQVAGVLGASGLIAFLGHLMGGAAARDEDG
jgi:hypothetical protein